MTRQREVDGEEIGRQAHALQDRRGVVLDVGLERLVGIVLGELAQRDLLDRDGQLQPLGCTGMPSATLRSAAARGSYAR